MYEPAYKIQYLVKITIYGNFELLYIPQKSVICTVSLRACVYAIYSRKKTFFPVTFLGALHAPL